MDDEVKIKARQAGQLIDALFSDRQIPDSDLENIRVWLSDSNLDDLKDEILREKFIETCIPGNGIQYARKLWPGIAARLGMNPDLDRILDRDAGKGAHTDGLEKEANQYKELSRRRIRPSLRRALIVAAVAIPAVVAVVILYRGSKPTAIPTVASLVVDTITTVATAEDVQSEDTATQITPRTDAGRTDAVKSDPPVEKAGERIIYDIAVNAPQDQHRHIQLADNTTVLVNNGGQVVFSSSDREAHLVGEAFFKVEKGHEQPFRITTESLTINVTGTEFNVKAVPGANQTVIDLLEGSVKVQAGVNDVELKPMERLTLDNNSGIIKFSRTADNGWWDQPMNFNGYTMAEILELLEGYYDIDLLGREQINGPVQHVIKFDKMSPIRDVLDVLEQIEPRLECIDCDEGIKVSMNTQDNHEHENQYKDAI